MGLVGLGHLLIIIIRLVLQRQLLAQQVQGQFPGVLAGWAGGQGVGGHPHHDLKIWDPFNLGAHPHQSPVLLYYPGPYIAPEIFFIKISCIII